MKCPLEDLQQRFDYSVEVQPVNVQSSPQRQISNGGNVFYCSTDEEDRASAVVAPLATRQEVVRLGPFPNYGLRETQESLSGWMRLTAATIASAPPKECQGVLRRLAKSFDFPIALLESPRSLPELPRKQILAGEDVVLYSAGSEGNFAATRFQRGDEVVVFGTFPRFDEREHAAATITLAIVLLPVAAAIALLLRPVARQLRYVERTAKGAAGGKFSARVDEHRVDSARSLAQFFNHMGAALRIMQAVARPQARAPTREQRCSGQPRAGRVRRRLDSDARVSRSDCSR